MQFQNIKGHEEIKNRLIHSVQNDRISHAQLFLGPEGNGGLAMAFAYAQYINCHHPTDKDSCGDCSSCRKMKKIIHPDIHFSFPFIAKKGSDISSAYLGEWREAFLSHPYLTLDTWRNYLSAENKQVNINVTEAHDIIKKLSLKSFEANYKVLILWLPEFLDKSGNTLLKLIEEPPPKTLFLLVSQNTEKILPTILSRTQLLKIPAYKSKEIQENLTNTYDVEPSRATELSLIADGNMHKAILSLEKEQKGFFGLMISWLRDVVTDNGAKFIAKSEEEFPSLGRENQKSFLLYAIHMFRQVMLYQQNLERLVHLGKEEMSFVRNFSALYEHEQLEAAIKIFEDAFYHVERNANTKILFLDVSLQLVLIFKFHSLPKGAQYI